MRRHSHRMRNTSDYALYETASEPDGTWRSFDGPSLHFDFDGLLAWLKVSGILKVVCLPQPMTRICRWSSQYENLATSGRLRFLGDDFAFIGVRRCGGHATSTATHFRAAWNRFDNKSSNRVGRDIEILPSASFREGSGVAGISWEKTSDKLHAFQTTPVQRRGG